MDAVRVYHVLSTSEEVIFESLGHRTVIIPLLVSVPTSESNVNLKFPGCHIQVHLLPPKFKMTEVKINKLLTLFLRKFANANDSCGNFILVSFKGGVYLFFFQIRTFI